MSSVGTANSYASDILSLLTGNALGGPQASQASAANVVFGQDRGPATLVDLSDQVKHLLERAISERRTADRLKAFVEQLGGVNASAQDASQSSQDVASDVTQAFEQLSGGAAALGDGVSVQSYQRDNKEYVTFSDSQIAATNVTASSDRGAVSVTSVGTQTESLTFVVDFAKGAISVEQAESTSLTTSVQIGSTLA